MKFVYLLLAAFLFNNITDCYAQARCAPTLNCTCHALVSVDPLLINIFPIECNADCTCDCDRIVPDAWEVDNGCEEGDDPSVNDCDLDDLDCMAESFERFDPYQRKGTAPCQPGGLFDCDGNAIYKDLPG